MSGLDEIYMAVEIITKHHSKISILHCVSEYPASYKNINLNSIPYLKNFPNYKIGYSDHSINLNSKCSCSPRSRDN